MALAKGGINSSMWKGEKERGPATSQLRRRVTRRREARPRGDNSDDEEDQTYR